MRVNLNHMKKILFIITSVLVVSCTPTYHTTTVVRPVNPTPSQQVYPAQNQEAYPTQNQEEKSYQVFYDELAPYGKWIDYPGEGYVWSPDVDQSFQPYATNGQWVYTDQGWTWASDYQWGWAAFHYGRWFYEDGYGWLWMPGHEWAPAWVTWGQSGSYYGWAPLGPHIEANQQWTPPQNSWTFVRQEHMSESNVGRYAEDRNTTTTIIKNTTIINNTTTIFNKNVVNNNVENNNVTNNNVNNSRVNNTNVTNNNINNSRVDNTNVTNTNVNNSKVNNSKVNNTNETNTNVTNNKVNNSNVTNTNVTNNTNNKIIINNNLPNNHTLINKGPQLSEVQKVTPVPIAKATIVENSKPAQTVKVNNTLVLYKPVIKENNAQNNANKQPAPLKVLPFKKNNPRE